jgi:hypothetical protein
VHGTRVQQQQQQNDLFFWATNPPSQGYGAAGYLLAALAAATILSKRLTPRKESQHGLKRRSPYEGPFGIVVQRQLDR